MPAVSASAVPEILARFGRVDAVKVKVAERGQSLDDDAARVAAVRAALPDAAIRVDANGGWDVPAAVEALTRLAAVGLEYAEQPVPEIEGLAEVRRRLRAAGVPVLIAADESVRKEDDPLKVARAGAADLIVVKVAPLGGVRRALDLVAQAGMPAVVSSALDTSVGIRAGLALAAALPELPYACGLGTVSLLAADVTTDPLVADDGAIRLRDAVADEGLLEQYAAPSERRDWWLARPAPRVTPCTPRQQTLPQIPQVSEQRFLTSCRFSPRTRPHLLSGFPATRSSGACRVHRIFI